MSLLVAEDRRSAKSSSVSMTFDIFPEYER